MRSRSFETTDRFEMGPYEPTSALFKESFLIAGVMNASLNEDGKWLAAIDRLNTVVKNGANSTATAFISGTVHGSAAELLSGRRAMAERTSATDTSEKDGQEAPGLTAVNIL